MAGSTIAIEEKNGTSYDGTAALDGSSLCESVASLLLRSRGPRGPVQIYCAGTPQMNSRPSAPLSVLAIFGPPRFPLGLDRNDSRTIEPALNLHPCALQAQNDSFDQIVPLGHRLLLIGCYICAMKDCAFMRRVQS